MSVLGHWERQPCPATSETGRPCVLSVNHSACHVWDDEKGGEVESLRRQLAGAVEAWERVNRLSGWIVRDRNEPDKVITYAQELARLATRDGGQ